MDEDDDEGGNTGAARYPCMPSLVSLQQMRNRLHLAYLGKKLMKWTALATGRELRKIATDMNTAYGDFNEDIKNCYILLARSRYFYTNLNKMVVENVPRQASVRVTTSTKSISGVKVIQFEIIETGEDPYEHLAIEKGGQIVKKTKDAWLDLLKRMIMILQLRQGFQQIDEANKTATKRENVLTKTVIPRIHSSIHYIILELEELAREELYRIKKIVEYKRKKKAKLEEKKSEAAVKITKVKISSKIELQPAVLDTVEPPKPLPKVEPIPEPLVKEELKPKPLKVESKPIEAPSIENSSKPCHICPQVCQSKIAHLKDELTTIISTGNDFMNTKTGNVDFGSFLIHCENVKVKMDEVFKSEQPKASINIDLLQRIEHLKSHLRIVTDVAKELRDKIILSPSVQDFCNLCQRVHDKLNLYFDIGDPNISGAAKERLEDLKLHIKDIEKMAEDYKNQGIVAPGSEKFLNACARVKSKLDTYKKNIEDVKKLEHLKDHVINLEHLTTGFKEDGMTSNSIEEFLLACNEFKVKIEKYKNEDKTPHSHGEITKLIGQIDTAIELSKIAQRSGLISDSVQDFIQSCENVKQMLEQKGRSQGQSAVLEELRTNLGDVVRSILKLKSTGLITTSVENFLKSCEITQKKIDLYERISFHDDRPEGRLIYPNYNPHEAADFGIALEPCDRCQDMWIEEHSSSVILPPCKTCADTQSNSIKPEPVDKRRSVQSPESSTDNFCKSCANTTSSDEDIGNVTEPSYADDEPSHERSLINDEPLAELGLFEKKVKTVVKITRTLNADGTIKEEREIVTTKTERHDPNETQLKNVIEGESSIKSEAPSRKQD